MEGAGRAAEPSVPMVWHLALKNSLLEVDGLPKSIRLGPGLTIVGRTAGTKIASGFSKFDLLVSGHHAEFFVSGEGTLSLTDRSSNGTELNGVGVAKGTATSVFPGASVVFGSRGPLEQATKKDEICRRHCQKYFSYVANLGEPPGATQIPLQSIQAATPRVNSAASPAIATGSTQVPSTIECSQDSSAGSDGAGLGMTPDGIEATEAGPSNPPTMPPEAKQTPDSAAAASGAPQAEAHGVLRGPFLDPVAAACRLKYDDCNAFGNFALDHVTGLRTPVLYSAHEALPDELARKTIPYESLRAFETNDGRGWGACCAMAINKGDVVVEAIG